MNNKLIILCSIMVTSILMLGLLVNKKSCELHRKIAYNAITILDEKTDTSNVAKCKELYDEELKLHGECLECTKNPFNPYNIKKLKDIEVKHDTIDKECKIKLGGK